MNLCYLRNHDVMSELTLGYYTANAAIAAAAVASSVAVADCVEAASAAIILLQKIMYWLLIEMLWPLPLQL